MKKKTGKKKALTSSWFNYAKFYSKIAKWLRQRDESKQVIAVELGVWKGHSIGWLASNCPTVEVYGVDLFEDTYRYQAHPRLQKEAKTVYDHFLTSLDYYECKNVQAIRSLSWEAAKRFDDESVDFLFIDADHSYEAVKADIIAWLPKMKTDGIIAGHDFDNPKHPGVKQAVLELLGEPQTTEGTVWFFHLPIGEKR
jgi:predicted O-methyltransferase YrrM